MQSKERAGERPLHLAGQSGRAPQKKGLQLGGEPPRSRSRMGPALGPGLQGERSFPREAAPVPCRARKVESFTADPPPPPPALHPPFPSGTSPPGTHRAAQLRGLPRRAPRRVSMRAAAVEPGRAGSGAEHSAACREPSPHPPPGPRGGTAPTPARPPYKPPKPCSPPPGGAAPQKCVGRVPPRGWGRPLPVLRGASLLCPRTERGLCGGPSPG